MDKSILLVIVSGVVTGLTGYFIGRPKNKAEAKKLEEESISKEISNLKDIIDSWKEYAMDQEKRIEKQGLTIKEQQEEIQQLKAKIEELSKEVKHQCTICDYKKFYDKNTK